MTPALHRAQISTGPSGKRRSRIGTWRNSASACSTIETTVRPSSTARSSARLRSSEWSLKLRWRLRVGVLDRSLSRTPVGGPISDSARAYPESCRRPYVGGSRTHGWSAWASAAELPRPPLGDPATRPSWLSRVLNVGDLDRYAGWWTATSTLDCPSHSRPARSSPCPTCLALPSPLLPD